MDGMTINHIVSIDHGSYTEPTIWYVAVSFQMVKAVVNFGSSVFEQQRCGFF